MLSRIINKWSRYCDKFAQIRETLGSNPFFIRITCNFNLFNVGNTLMEYFLMRPDLVQGSRLKKQFVITN